MEDKRNEILRLKKEKNTVIMAHYYVEDEVQEIADYVGDSYYLSEMATKAEADTIVLCGVSFMGESAKLLNPEKKVLLPDESADCPMAHMASVEKIEEVRLKYKEDVAVVCYVNSTAELKSHSDVCVTSSNALKVVKALPNPVIYFIPDKHLGSWIAAQLPEKTFIFNEGGCPIHTMLTAEHIMEAKGRYPGAEVLVHPECQAEVSRLADYVGSTSGIIDYATTSDGKEFIIGTELGVMYELKKRNPDKVFYAVKENQICADMKKITLDKVLSVLQGAGEGVVMSEDFLEKAHTPLKRMLELSR
ncbi:MAG: quinolinate synthase NadA [Clostridia bacterium]|nr:quinolinate synthase NadA [Lachnospiraceae bacterium]NCC02040.1 quinolinate synthase NadA [Clostridia bacterium]NCD04023.1 quinolinate synthase NadA [Clostridia bacterium]